MSWRQVLIGCLAAAALTAGAACPEVDTSFAPGGKDGMPRGWEKHGYANYQPFAAVTVDGEGADRTLHVSEVNGRSGCGLMPEKRLAVRGGDVVTFTCELRGKGALNVFLTHYGKDGKNAQVSGPGSQQRTSLSADWRKETFVLNVRDGAIPTESALVIFEFAHGTVADVRHLTADVRRTLRSRNFEFNPIWTFFRDDFESAGKSRVGNPRIAAVSHTGGMTVGTKVGRFAAKDGRKTVVLSEHCPLQGGGKHLRVSFRIFELDADAKLALRMRTSGGRAGFPLPETVRGMAYPVECVFRCGDEGEWSWDFRSLTDGATAFVSGTDALFGRAADDLSVELVLFGGTREVAASLDEFVIGEDRAVLRSGDLPKPYSPPKTFDPVKVGLKRVFADEFEAPAGTPYDRTKWFIPDYYGYKDNGRVRHDGKGNLEIVVDYGKGTDKLEAMDLWTHDSWTYGYFEARVRFTRNRGFWAAFWMYSLSHRLATEDGLEIDCFEDYGIRGALERGDAGIDLQHALHANYFRTLKSWGRYSHIDGSLDDFHTVGCLRTPFGVSIYLDGRLAGNTTAGYDQSTATFDAFRQNLVSVPLHMVVSACVIGSWRGKEHPEVKFPESYLIDWVRAYELPPDQGPRLKWKDGDDRFVVREGERLVLEPEIASAAPVKEVHLFDDGAYIATATKAPWRFDVPFSSEGYRTTRFMSVGNQGLRPDFHRTLHSFTAFAVDAEGRIGTFADDPRRIACPELLEDAKGPKAVQSVPGVVEVDARKGGFAERLQTGVARVVEIDVAADGTYEGQLPYCSPMDRNQVLIAVDGKVAAVIGCPGREDHSWSKETRRASVSLKLAKGRHRLTFMVFGMLSFGPLELKGK